MPKPKPVVRKAFVTPLPNATPRPMTGVGESVVLRVVDGAAKPSDVNTRHPLQPHPHHPRATPKKRTMGPTRAVARRKCIARRALNAHPSAHECARI